jgi:hypothetical protein
MNDTLTSATWWKAAAKRALITAIAVAIPYFGAVTVFGSINWLTLGGAVLLAFIASLLTSLAGIAEVQGVVKPEWEALLERSVKTFAQALVAGVGSSLLFQDVHWSVILQASIIAAITSLLRSLVADLPETPAPIDAGTAIPGQVSSITSLPVLDTPAALPVAQVDPVADTAPMAATPPTA